MNIFSIFDQSINLNLINKILPQDQGIFFIIDGNQFIKNNRNIINPKLKTNEILMQLINNKNSIYKIKIGTSHKGLINNINNYKNDLNKNIIILLLIVLPNYDNFKLNVWKYEFLYQIISDKKAFLSKDGNKLVFNNKKNLIDGINISHNIINKLFSGDNLTLLLNELHSYRLINEENYGKINKFGKNLGSFKQYKNHIRNKIGCLYKRNIWPDKTNQYVKFVDKEIYGNWPSSAFSIKLNDQNDENGKDFMVKIFYISKCTNKNNEVFEESENAGLLKNYIENKSISVFICMKNNYLYRGEYIIKKIMKTVDNNSAIFELAMDFNSLQYWKSDFGRKKNGKIHKLVLKNSDII